jgi:hypothetical protein
MKARRYLAELALLSRAFGTFLAAENELAPAPA